MMWTQVTAAALLALVEFGSQANAQAPCTELTRLRSEVAEASKQTRGGPSSISGRCESYGRLAMAWDAVAKYAKDHRESCDVSTVSLNDFEKYHDEAVKARNNVCAGRPARPFPPEVILR